LSGSCRTAANDVIDINRREGRERDAGSSAAECLLNCVIVRRPRARPQSGPIDHSTVDVGARSISMRSSPVCEYHSWSHIHRLTSPSGSTATMPRSRVYSMSTHRFRMSTSRLAHRLRGSTWNVVLRRLKYRGLRRPFDVDQQLKIGRSERKKSLISGFSISGSSSDTGRLPLVPVTATPRPYGQSCDHCCSQIRVQFHNLQLMTKRNFYLRRSRESVHPPPRHLRARSWIVASPAVDRFPTNDRQGVRDHPESIVSKAVSTRSGVVLAGQVRQWSPGACHCQHVQ
jgi:hypothetical protein